MAQFRATNSTSLSHAQPFNKCGDGPQRLHHSFVLPTTAPSLPNDIEAWRSQQRNIVCNATANQRIMPHTLLRAPPVLPALRPLGSVLSAPATTAVEHKRVRLSPLPPASLSQSMSTGVAPRPPVTICNNNTELPRAAAISNMLCQARDPNLAIVAKDPQIGALMKLMHDSLHGSYAPSTLRNDRGYWREWSYFCSEILGTSPLRTDISANIGWDCIGHQREVFLLSLFTVWKISNMKPRSSQVPVANPRSAHGAISSIRRSHALVTGIELVKTPQINKIIRGFLRSYVQQFGPDVLVPKRKEPMRMSVVKQMVNLPSGSRISPSGRYAVIHWLDPFWTSWRACLLTMLSTGFRKNEISLHSSAVFTKGRLSRASIWWHIGAVTYSDPDVRTLQSFTHGDYVIMKPPLAKNDQFGQAFGNKPIYLPYHESVLCAALALRDLEVRFPMRGAIRQHAPLFAMDARLQPFRHDVIDSIFHRHIGLVVGSEAAQCYSLHSFRIGLACALLKSGKPLPLIQALLRWMSPESLIPYARLDPLEYGNHLIHATSVEITGVTPANLPRLDNDDLVVQCQSVLQSHSDTVFDMNEP